ncbi:MAG TPA: succinyl-diaminopimelate desuccinylase [Candidatus Dormibacteraeota bacterium]|jgi:succinyl-diaminopimelate desuccinylase|nr:succinyl-diaminopimelate desuccinylase [Candidatus Dormibacteraeota bacterium]
MTELAELALELVNTPSVSRQEHEVTAWIGRWLEERAPHLEIQHRQEDAIVFGEPGEPDVVLAGHSDTVPAQDNIPGRIDDGWVYGLGSSDMKGSLAVMLALAAERRHDRLRPLYVIFGREEVAVSESVLAQLFERCPQIRRARLALMMEPTENRIEAGCLGNMSASLTYRGVAAHSARPWLGRNAIHEAVLGLRRVAEAGPRDVTLSGLTFREVLSVTAIEGGVANNVIPDRVVCGLNFRFAGNRDRRQAEDRLRELVGEEGELELRSYAPGAPVALDNPLVQDLIRRSGLEVRPKQAWTPIAEFAEQGMDAVNLGPGDPGLAHRRDERVSVAAMQATLALLRDFLTG